MPLLLLFFLFIVIPVMELYVLIEVGSEIGAFSTIWLVILTAAIGAWLVRRQGVSVLMRVRENLEKGEPPAIEMLEGALLLITGVALLLPGFVTDAIGFLLLVPPFRRWIIIKWLKRSGVMTTDGTIRETRSSTYIIEGEFKREDDSNAPR